MRLWSFAMEHVVCLLNHVPNEDYNNITGIFQIELYTGTKEDFSELNNEHTWGVLPMCWIQSYRMGKSFQNGISELYKVSI